MQPPCSPGRVLARLLLATILFTGYFSAAFAAEAGNGFERWTAHRDALAKDPTVLRLYGFQEKTGDTVHNLAAGGSYGDIVLGANPLYVESYPLKAAEDFPTWSTGRWPQKGALAFGTAPRSAYRSHFYAAKENRFTASMWVRVNREAGQKATTELCYVENTLTSGWRITSGPGYTVFVLARPTGAVAAYGAALSPHVWHHVAAVLDKTSIYLYIDGKLAKSKEFDGIYTQAKMTEFNEKRPELDNEGLILGNRTLPPADSGPVPRPLLDMDEFVLYDRALSAEEVAAECAAGVPDEPADVQVTRRKQELTRQAALDSIAVTIPTDSYGYFTIGKPFSATVAAPALPGIDGPLRATFTLKDYSLSDAAEKDLVSVQRPVPAGASATAPFTLARCGLYSLDITVSDAAGAVLKQHRFPIAGILPLPPTAAIPLSSPLAGHGIVDMHPAETVLGGRYDRTIAPFLRILPDGSYAWGPPDDRVAAILKYGLEPLYTIYPPFNMPHSTPQELAKDPDRWAAWVRTLVGHFKGKVRYWEIWNEPNAVPGFSAKDYVTLLKTAYTAIKEVDPAAKVVGGSGVYTIPQWTEAVLAAGGGPYMDILSVHNYVGTSPITYRNRYHKVEQVQALLKKYLGHSIPLWNSEGGIHQPARVDGRPLSDAALLQTYGSRANKDDGWPIAGVHAIMMTTEHRSACWNVQSILLDLADGEERYFTLMGAGTFYPFKTSSEGLPTEKGISYAALASVLETSKSVQWLPLSNSKAAGILVTDQSGRRSAILFSDVPLEFSFEAGAAQSFKGMDFLGNPLQWQAGNGSLTLKTGDEPIYVQDVPAGFAERRLLSVNGFPAQLLPAQKVQGTLLVANPGMTPLPANLEAVSAAGKVALAATATVPPATTARVPFEFEADGTSRGPRTLRFSLKSGGKSISQLELPFYAAGPAIPVAQLAVAPATEAAWAGVRPEIVNQAANVVIGKPDVGFANLNTWQGPADCNYSVKTAWRPGDGVYLRIEVTDDSLHPTPPGNTSPWLWDGLELFVDTRSGPARTAGVGNGAQQIMVVPVLGAQSAPCAVNNLAGKNATVDAVFTSRAVPGGYLLEGKLSPKPDSGWELKAGSRIGLDFAIDDNDDGLKRKTQITLHGTANNANDTSRWGEYQLSTAN